MADFKEIDNARRKLGLDEEATIDEIKSSYRVLSKKYHPDKHSDKDKINCEKEFKKINDAYQTVMNYTRNYRYSFDKKDIQRTKIEKIYQEHIRRFYDGWWDNL
jgi:DnaJ-class molecular chaperone